MKFKKRNLFSTPLLAAMCMFVSVPVCAAEKVEYRQVYYNIDEESLTATATYMTLNPEEVNYPSGSSTFYIGKPVEWQEKSYTVYEIGEYAFLNSAKPYNINLDGETLKKISKSAFKNSSVRTFRFNDVAIEEICDSAFYHVANFSISDFPESLQKIGNAAFMDVQDFSVRSLSLTGSIKSIGDYAFANDNEYLKTLAFGDNISTIGRCAFKGCAGITEISVSADVPPSISEDSFDEDVYKTATLIVKSESLDAYKAADGWKNFINVRGVNPECYYDEPIYYSLDSEHKTATVIRHDSYKTLSEVSLPSAVDYLGEEYDVVAVGPEAFMGCDNLTVFSGSWKLNSLGERSFKDCGSLEKVSSISNVEVIPSECFSGCESLSSISLYCRVISGSAFKGCASIGEFTTPSKLEEIGEGAFESEFSVKKYLNFLGFGFGLGRTAPLGS